MRTHRRIDTGNSSQLNSGTVPELPPCYHFSSMAVNSELLKMLVCPVCRTAVEVVDGGQALKCSECHRVYPIRDDIPIMLVSEAKVEN